MGYNRCGVELVMFIYVRGWRYSNTGMYIGEDKVERSIHGDGEFIQVYF
jgi:hypothetical protein